MIDVHTHIGLAGRPPAVSSLSAGELVAKMDEWRIEKSVVLPLSDCPEGWWFASGTEEAIRAHEEFPDRLVPFCLIDPRKGDNSPETDFTETFDWYKKRGCRGLGEIVGHFHFDDPRALNLYRQAGAAGFPVVFCMAAKLGRGYGPVDDRGLPRLERALRECPDTTFVGHGPAFWSEISADVPEDERGWYPAGPVTEGGAVPRLMSEYPNLMGDLSARSAYTAVSRDPEFGPAFLERFLDRIMFGTDVIDRAQTADDPPILGFWQRLKEEGMLSDEAVGRIERGNAERLLGL